MFGVWGVYADCYEYGVNDAGYSRETSGSWRARSVPSSTRLITLTHGMWLKAATSFIPVSAPLSRLNMPRPLYRDLDRDPGIDNGRTSMQGAVLLFWHEQSRCWCNAVWIIDT
jgi:hypothetical protein